MLIREKSNSYSTTTLQIRLYPRVLFNSMREEQKYRKPMFSVALCIRIQVELHAASSRYRTTLKQVSNYSFFSSIIRLTTDTCMFFAKENCYISRKTLSFTEIYFETNHKVRVLSVNLLARIAQVQIL